VEEYWKSFRSTPVIVPSRSAFTTISQSVRIEFLKRGVSCVYCVVCRVCCVCCVCRVCVLCCVCHLNLKPQETHYFEFENHEN
jgi:hypothetical protein